MTDVGPTDLLPDQLTPEAAATRIAELKADPKFSEKYLNGELSAKAEFTRLHTIVGKGAADEAGLHRASQLPAMSRFADLHEKGSAQVARNGPVHLHERVAALNMKDQLLRDRGFMSRYFQGSREEAALVRQISHILASPVHKPEGTTP
jgi:hypothetical protein